MNAHIVTIRPETIFAIWQAEATRIANDHIRMSPNRAGELAAARILNLYAAQWETFEAALTARPNFGNLPDDDADIVLYEGLCEWNPSRDLQEMSGSRTILLDLDDPIARVA